MVKFKGTFNTNAITAILEAYFNILDLETIFKSHSRLSKRTINGPHTSWKEATNRFIKISVDTLELYRQVLGMDTAVIILKDPFEVRRHTEKQAVNIWSGSELEKGPP